ncbi:phosphoribosylformylglycinamidine cyclo-ligase [Capsulimonas corticalis]|uniref:Phosphoribosylformylglycinamidine cyclo-ligase n=1 Tax=Capsulimonas corticalis TaxID=2219043 RepID=A0A402D164_9BACT|nr:phosphoribosylformylglycinamidine cyclo-ligase [Capsulimonas corticalis]BDI31687.1 phosphoribosylformylglycinamidine cyclo-ligase [Capsulimonas corticalis]
MSEAKEQSAYARAGVDIDAATDAVDRMKSHIKKTLTPGVLTGVGSFGGMFALSALGTLQDPVLVSSIDGVGTKLKIAFATNRHDTIGRDLVNHCINDILVQGARPLFFLDYFGTGKLQPHVAEAVVKGLTDGCQAAGCALIGGETAEMPGLYGDGEYDLAGSIVGIVERAKIVDGSQVAPGDVLIGLASDGLHTNGYSLARQALLHDGQLPLETPIPELGGETLADVLLAPHRCYAPAVLSYLETNRVHAMAHITGGGFLDNIPRVLPTGVGVHIDRSAWTVPPIFGLIEKLGGVSNYEMHRVFNMGIGYVLVVPADDADTAIAYFENAGEKAVKLGVAIEGDGVELG